MTDYRVRVVGPLAAAAVLTAACGSDPAPSTAHVEASKPSGVAKVDACALLSKEEVGALIGGVVDGVASRAGAGCFWQNPKTLESVSVDLGALGTATGDTLPPIGDPSDPDLESAPGPDNTRLLAGVVEFAEGNRYNSVQVLSDSLSSEQAKATALDLIKKIRPQISG